MVKYLKREKLLRKLAFEERSFDGFLVANEANLLYFLGFPGAVALLIPREAKSIIYVHNVNYEQAKAEGKGFEVKLIQRSEKFIEKISVDVNNFKIGKLALDTLSFENHQSLATKLRKGAKLEMQNKLIWQLRKTKDSRELELMRKAGELTSEGMKAAYETIRPGMKEYEVAAEIEYAMRKRGSYGTAFETIVASGARSAFPHGGCTDQTILKGSLVVVDIGATYQYYRSDMTRTIVAGRALAKQKKIYQVVRHAQQEAFRATVSNSKASEIDSSARRVIDDAGYGEYFVHGLGHGVGLEVHEQPTLNPESKDRLGAGNVVTIEPGIYIVGFGGIRIEDTVLVLKKTSERFTQGPYTLERTG